MISNQKTLSPICRRELLALVGAAVAFRPFTAIAQPGKVPTIGALVVGSPGAEQFWKLFRDAMQQLGYVEGRNIGYEFRSDQGDTNRLRADELWRR